MNLMSIPISELLYSFPELEVTLEKYTRSLHSVKSLNLHQFFSTLDTQLSTCKSEIKQVFTDVFYSRYKELPLEQKIHLIVSQFHSQHRELLPVIINNAREVEYKYAEHPACPIGLSRILSDFSDDLCGHMDQEEHFLFPPLLARGEEGLFPIIAVTHHSHDRHMHVMADIEELTNDLVAPEGIGAPWVTLYEQLNELFLQLYIHILLENTLLFDE